MESLACFNGLFLFGSLVPSGFVISQTPFLHEKPVQPLTSILIIPLPGIRITKSASPKYLNDFFSDFLMLTG